MVRCLGKPPCGRRLFAGLFLALLVYDPCTATAQDGSGPKLARLIDTDADALLARFHAASGVERLRIGYAYGVVALREEPPETVAAFLDNLATAAQVERQLGPSWALAFQSLQGLVTARGGDLEGGRAVCARVATGVKQIKMKLLRLSTRACMAFIELRTGNLVEALVHARTGAVEARTTASRTAQLAHVGNEALVLFYSGFYDAAMDRYQELLSLGDQLTPYAARVLRFNLGLVYLKIGENEKALAAFEEGGRWTRELGQMNRALIADTQRAKALIALDRQSEARAVFEDWLNGEPSGYDADSVSNAYLTLGRAQLNLGDAAQALSSAAAGLAFIDAQHNVLRWGDLAHLKAQALKALDRPAMAKLELDGVIHFARTHQSQLDGTLLADALATLGDLAAAQGDYALAFASVQESRNLLTAANRKTLVERTSALDALFELEYTRHELDLAKSESARLESESRHRLLGLLALAGATGALLLVSLLLWDRRRRAGELRLQRNEAQQLGQLVTSRTQSLEARVTELMQQRAEMLTLERKLAEAEKYRALGVLTGGVAHDFNNLLAVIMGSAEMLELESRDPKLAGHLQAILGAGETGAEITRSLLAYARQQELKPRDVDVNTCLQDSAPLFRSTLGEQARLQLALESGMVCVDPSALTTAIINLVANAREAGAQSVRLTGAPDEASARYHIEVADDGIGMTETQLQHAFEPFFSTKDKTRSTGLGLSIVHGFAHQSGGNVRIEAVSGEGCVVTIELPLVVDATRARPVLQRPPRATAFREPLSILLVDDNPSVRVVIGDMLIADGHRVTAVGDARQALNSLAETAYDLLITDIMMPGAMNGMALADQVSDRYRDTRVLVITGFHDQGTTRHRLLHKPFSRDELLHAVDELVAREAELEN